MIYDTIIKHYKTLKTTTFHAINKLLWFQHLGLDSLAKKRLVYEQLTKYDWQCM